MKLVKRRSNVVKDGGDVKDGDRSPNTKAVTGYPHSKLIYFVLLYFLSPGLLESAA
jgi:hypothetical protein